MATSQAEALNDWVTGFIAAAGSEAGADAFVQQINDRILAQIPELASDPVLTADLRASTRSQWKSFLTVLERERQDVVLPPQATDLALSIARRGLDLSVLLKVYRIAGDAVWDYMVAVTDDIPDEGPDHGDALKLLWSRGGHWINESIERLVRIYLDEREAVQHGAFARRSATVQALLRGDEIPVDRASQELGHQLRAQQTCLVLWLDEAPADQTSAPLEALAQAIARDVGAPRPLTHAAGTRELWVWLATRGAPDVSRVPDIVASAGARAALGRTDAGIAGFRTSHREAVDAENLVITSGSEGTMTAYADVELACLVGGNPDSARNLVERELGGLAADDPALDPVRETLSHYLRHGCNIALTAKELYVHRNTVRYRLAQAEELIGHPLAERRTEIDLALRFASAWRRR